MKIRTGLIQAWAIATPVLLSTADTSLGEPSPDNTLGRVQAKLLFEPASNQFPFSPFSLGPEVRVDGKDKTVRLAHSVLVADEMGATDFHQTEALSDRVHAKKTFLLDSPEVSSAELFMFGGAKKILVNGKPLEESERLVSTGWTRARVPPRLLKAGTNEVILAGGGSLLLEPGRQTGCSFKSSDGGRTWSNQHLGSMNNHQGEYLVRLRLGRYAPRGWLLSPVKELWDSGFLPGGIGAPERLIRFRGLADLNKGQPEGTQIRAWFRTGTTPSPDVQNWTEWLALDKDYAPERSAASHRWAQLKFDLVTTRPQATPRLGKFWLEFELERTQNVFNLDLGLKSKDLRDFLTGQDKLKAEFTPPVVEGQVQGMLTSSVPFIYQAPSPRLKLLRERYQLDKVVAPGKTEMEQLMLLRHWVRNQWHTAWGSHPAAWMPPWDTLIILESKDQPDCLTMCTHYAAVFTQCCLALGWNARHCILDHHCVAEVWVDQHQKWVMMDAGNSAERADVGLHFERNGVPLSALELHLAHRSGKTDDIKVCFTPAKLMEPIAPLCRPAPRPKGKVPPRPDIIPLADLPNYAVCQLNNYRRYAFPGRNNYLTSLYPGELYQGWSEYFYDGYWWVGDSPDDPQLSPEYSRHLPPSRPQDIDWSLNWTRIHLCRTKEAGELQVDLETHTPNLARLEKVTKTLDPASKDPWQPTAANFVWKLRPGKNVLRARGVNHWGRAGNESRVELEWTPAKR